MINTPTTTDDFYLKCFDGDLEIEISGFGCRRANIKNAGSHLSGVRKVVITCEVGAIPVIDIQKLGGLPARKEEST